jgi:hypothetical protein
LKDVGQKFVGTLTIDNTSFPIDVARSQTGLDGSFESGGSRFPVAISQGEGPNQIVIESEGSLFEMSRIRPAVNPLTAQRTRPTNPLTGGSVEAGGLDLSGSFNHPEGYFGMNVPATWSANMMSGDMFSLDTGSPNEVTLALLAELEPQEVGRPMQATMQSAHEMIDGLLAQNFGLYTDGNQPEVNFLKIDGLDGGQSTRRAQGANGDRTIWQGVVVDGKSAFVLMSAMPIGRERELVPILEGSLQTLRLNKGWNISDFGAASGRRVTFNGEVLSDEDLAGMEGGTPVIPDGSYWYDAKSGMAGTIDGPTEAYLATGLNLGGDLATNASGGRTQVAFNGRYLHPIDLAGLEMYFGAIQPGRYWLDGAGNYGQEGGPQEGNLVEEIAAIQLLAASVQAQYQQQLNSTVQQYQGQGGGYYGQGGGYQQGGGSVYSHFPNLGASGTGVSVANVGGGDTIVNAGGVLWWPGK